ncbi:Atu4866 domain-containing protein [Xanthomonas axonopodis pv. poinsettiicola]|uniref:Atu4866 domain-containing protein n=1 Tax=Xanthomonas TaxID=338 RepID=UPI001E62A645|nr:Atu4866 domain-containing protein [Xanthomonas codiaei]MCC8536233.1 Atu4866 domain-containing protein [Xanthomonas codiaei]
MSDARMTLAVAVALGAGAAVFCTAAASLDPSLRAGDDATDARGGQRRQAHPYLGTWVTADGSMRRELLPTGYHAQAGGRGESGQGRYVVERDRIRFLDARGSFAEGIFVGSNELHHGGRIFHRQGKAASAS